MNITIWSYSILFSTSFLISGLSQEEKINLVLSDQTEVILCHQVSIEESNRYYYLPLNLRISRSSAGPEFSFMPFNTIDDNKPPSEGILHLLLTWGLDTDQRKEATRLLQQQVDTHAYLAGSIPLIHDEISHLEIIGDNDLGQAMRHSLNSSAPVPLTPGSKMALSFKFSNENFRIFNNALENVSSFDKIRFRVYLKSAGIITRACTVDKIILEKKFSELIEHVL